MNQIKIALLFLTLNFGNFSSAEQTCQIKGQSAATIYLFCPKKMSHKDVAKYIKSIGEKHIHPKMNLVIFYIFNSMAHTPKSSKEFDKMSDANWKKYETAVYNINRNNGNSEFKCKEPSDNEFHNCSELLN